LAELDRLSTDVDDQCAETWKAVVPAP
jgi:hypothetical protein